MAGMLLLADPARVEELRTLSGVPDSLFAPLSNDYGYGDDREEPRILLADPAFLRDGKLGREEMDARLAQLMGHFTVHLAVTGSAADGVRSPFRELADWYRNFRQAAATHLRDRGDNYRHILVLICTEDVPATDWPDLQELVRPRPEEERDNRLVHRCYVMLRHLECGESTLYHAKYVWPVAVGRLLMGFLARGMPRDDTGTFAWRAFELGLDLPAGLRSRMYARELEFLRGTLMGGKPDCPSDAFDPRQTDVTTSSLLAFQTETEVESPWYAYPAQDKGAEMNDWGRTWEPRFKTVGLDFGRRLSEEVLAEDPPARQAAQEVWQRVHEDPARVHAALEDPRLTQGPDLREQLAGFEGRWDGLQSDWRAQEQARDEAQACGEELDAAQKGFVGYMFRLFFVFAVTLFVGYFAMSAFHLLFGSLFWPAIIATCGGVAALATATILYIVENRIGRAAVPRYQEVLREASRATDGFNLGCQRAIVEASRFWGRLRAKGAALRLRALLLRARFILNREFAEPSEGQLQVHEEVAGEPPSAAAGRSLAQLEGSKFVRLTSILVPVTGENVEGLAAIPQALEKELLAELRGRWTRFCEDRDRANAGHLPAQELSAMLAAFRRLVRQRMGRHLYKQMVEDIVRNPDPSQAGGWEEELANRRRTESHYYCLSCPGTRLEFSPEDFTARFLIRPDYQSRELEEATQGASLERPAFLTDLPCIGFWIQEARVTLGEDSTGHIWVRPHVGDQA